MHQREIKLALPGQRVAAERHGDLLHRNFKSSRRERFHEDVGRPTDSSKRGRAVLHAGGQGLPADAPRPEIDPTKGSLDHFAINLAPYDAEAVTAYLTEKGHAPYAQGQRYGADGDGYSIYLKDPEGTVVELKSGN